MWPTSITSRCSPVTRSLIHSGGSVGCSPRIAAELRQRIAQRAETASAVCRARSLPLCQMASASRRARRLRSPGARRALVPAPTAAAAGRRRGRRRRRDGPDRSLAMPSASSCSSASAFATASGCVDCGVRFFATDAAARDRLSHVRRRRAASARATRRASARRTIGLSLHEPPHERADDLVRVAERHALRDEVVGDVGREQQSGRRARRGRRD